MKLKHLLIITFFVFAELSILNAQEKYLNGYIIKNNDTINCYIKKTSVFNLESEISIKNNLNDKNITTYKPNQLTGFFIENFGFFKSEDFTYRRTNDIMKSGNPTDTESPIFRKSNSFIRVLAKGDAFLYVFIDPKQKKHFFIEKDTVFKELYIKKKFATKTENGKEITGLVIQKNYIGILLTFFHDCQKIKNRILNTDLTEKSLTDITNLYNKCKSPKKYNENKIQDIKKVLFGKSVYAGAISNQYIITGAGHDWLFRSLHETPVNYTGGANFSFTFPQLSFNFSLNTGISYYYTPYKFQYDTVIQTVNYHYEGDISTHYLKFPVSVKYTLNKHKVQPYFFGGIFFNKIIGCKNSLIIRKYNDFKDITENKQVFEYTDGTTGKTITALKNFESGFSLGGGIKYVISEKLSIYTELKYDKGNGLSSLMTFGNKSNFISIIAGIDF